MPYPKMKNAGQLNRNWELLGHHLIPKEGNSLVNNQELAAQENFTIARVSIQK